MFTVLNIVKNKFNETIGYDIKEESTTKVYRNVKISELVGYKFTNASYVNGKYPYIRGNKALPTREENSDILLYHGSNHIVKQPLYGFGKCDNDYGRGFYTTQIPERAEEWALLMSGDSYCNVYSFNVEGLNIVDLDTFGPLAWIAEVLKNRGMGEYDEDDITYPDFCRKYCVDLSNVDVVVGYRADDSYFKIIKSFVRNQITVDEVVNFFYKARLGRQIFLKSEKSFSEEHIKFNNAYKVPNTKLKYAQNNDSKAREVVDKLIKDRIRKIQFGEIILTKMTYTDCLRTNYKYDKEKGVYYV